MAAPHYADPEYRAARAALTANPLTPCWKRCGRLATTIDHVPAIRLHDHRRGAGCCVLLPACRKCNCGSGGTLGNKIRWRRPSSGWL